MDFHYNTEFPTSSPEAYERLLLDVMIGDQTLFMRRDAVEVAWRWVMPILEQWSQNQRPLPTYPDGSWGPAEADALIEATGRHWRKLETCATTGHGGPSQAARTLWRTQSMTERSDRGPSPAMSTSATCPRPANSPMAACSGSRCATALRRSRKSASTGKSISCWRRFRTRTPAAAAKT